MSEILESQESEDQEGVIHPEVIKELKNIPGFLGVILVMPQSPSKITDKMIEYRHLQDLKDKGIQESLHDYYNKAA